MNRFTTGRVLAFRALLFLLAAHATNAHQQAEWTWKDRHGRTRTKPELYEILQDSNERSSIRANLMAADLSGAVLPFANLHYANLAGAKLVGANLFAANLSGAVLDGADFLDVTVDMSGKQQPQTSTHLVGADLQQANLQEADLTNADFYGANMGGAIFEPKSLPEIRGIAGARNLELLTYRDNPDALVQLRKVFVDGGFRNEERKITYALKRRETELSRMGCTSKKAGDKTRAILWSSDSNLANCGAFVLNRMFLDWTCQYGMSPGRPLILGVLLWLLCSILYFASIHARGEAGLRRIYGQSPEEDPSAHRRVETITTSPLTQTRGVPRLIQFLRREWVVLRASMFFSLMSAFNIGFRDINFGRWLRLLTRQEFDMKAMGWARVVAGWQSLISVYFIALWVLTYFGRPFG